MEQCDICIGGLGYITLEWIIIEWIKITSFRLSSVLLTLYAAMTILVR